MKSTQGTALSRAKRCTAASKASVILASGAVEAIGNPDPHPLADLIGGTAVNLCDEELDEAFTLDPLPSNTFGKF